MRDFTLILDQLQAERNLIISFFAGFSRFEFALIRGGFAGGDAHHATANWLGFAAAVEQHFVFDRTNELQDAIDYLEQQPPRRLALVNNALNWIPNTDAAYKSRLGA